MTRFNRIHRRPDHWSSPHARARARAAERMDGPLGLAEATWLDEHLASCAACAAVADQYERDRTALRALRTDLPEPPRDLWARTSAAIEREAAGSGIASDRAGLARFPLGALSGVAAAVIVVAVGAASLGLFGGGPNVAVVDPTATGGPTAVAPGTQAPPSDSIAPAPTPLLTDAGAVAWLRRSPDGKLAFTNAPVEQVCPSDGQAGCAALDDGEEERLDLTVTPKTVIGSPVDDQAVVVTDDGEGGDRLVVVSLPERERGGPAPASPEPEPSPSEQPAPTPSDDPIVPPSVDPSGDPGPTPSISPEPTVAASLALANDITLVGQSAAFNADGTWFAFTARPTDDSRGPDVYVWRVGDSTATRLTDDGASTFASWAGSTVVVSRPADPAAVDGTAGTSVAIDPTTGDATAFDGAAWRPALDPSGTRAVVWLGTVALVPEPGAWRPLDGQLALVAWPPVVTDAAASPVPGVAPQVIDAGPIGELDVRWDETGTWVAIWIGDPLGSGVGRLSLYHVDPVTGLIEQPEGAPSGDPALAGFSIGHGRLAWVGPPGADGEGSNIQVAAWVGDDVGTAESVPGQGIVVIR